MGWIADLFDKHLFVRRVMVFWAMGLITWVVVIVFSDLDKITATVVSALGIVVGILATAIGFYVNTRGKADQ